MQGKKNDLQLLEDDSESLENDQQDEFESPENDQQIDKSDLQLIFELLLGISRYALERGLNNVSDLKNLFRLSTIYACFQKYQDKPRLNAEMDVATELGISLRNVQRALKQVDELLMGNMEPVRIRAIRWEIAMFLSEWRTLEEIQSELGYLIHVPYELQKSELRAILKEMEAKNLVISKTTNSEVRSKTANRKVRYKVVQEHVNLVDMSDMPSRMEAMLRHLDSFSHTIGSPYCRKLYLTQDIARKIQPSINDYLVKVGEALEKNYKKAKGEIVPTYTFYFGSTPTSHDGQENNVAEIILECIRQRFRNPHSASFAHEHWYSLTFKNAQIVFKKVCKFIDKQANRYQEMDNDQAIPFAFHFGLADRNFKNKGDDHES